MPLSLLPIDLFPFVWLSKNLGLPSEKFLLKVVLFASFLTELTKEICGALCIGFTTVIMANRILQQLKCIQRKEFFIFKMYRSLQVWDQHANISFLRYAVSTMIVFGLGLSAFCNYGIIQFRSVLHPLLLIVLILTSFVVVLVIQTLLPQAAFVHENSVGFLRKVKVGLRKGYLLRMWNSCRHLGIQNGPFGVVKLSTWGTILMLDIDTTVNLLLTF